tara:strand:+ start:16716 stop:16868 length:153 start_codon:yes stop_codon:yes gene_type:complete
MEVLFYLIYTIRIFFSTFKELNMSCPYTPKGLEILRRSLKNSQRTAEKLP